MEKQIVTKICFFSFGLFLSFSQVGDPHSEKEHQKLYHLALEPCL